MSERRRGRPVNRTRALQAFVYCCSARRAATPRRAFRPVPRGGSTRPGLATRPTRGRSHVQHVDPPDLTLWPTLRHLYPLWRAQWRLVAIGLSCAVAFTALSLTIPI